jgi:hypothetical protein
MGVRLARGAEPDKIWVSVLDESTGATGSGFFGALEQAAKNRAAPRAKAGPKGRVRTSAEEERRMDNTFFAFNSRSPSRRCCR